jgi:hypothetical protein
MNAGIEQQIFKKINFKILTISLDGAKSLLREFSKIQQL